MVAGCGGEDDVVAHVAVYVDGEVVVAVARVGTGTAGRRGGRGWCYGSR